MPADAGIRFGHYVLLRRIARGGMAEVFLAQQRGLEGFDRRVAVKRILPHLADSPDFVRMFLGEAKLAAQLSHPNIVHIYEFGKVEQDYFIAMEFVDGVHAGQLFKMGEQEKLPPTLIARIGADAATALHYAHELRAPSGKQYGLVHRDVSPAIIMVSYDGIVKLCDFGIAKAAAVGDQLTNPGQVKGKYAYMSPEQTIAAPLDGRSDVFSLAIVLWELLTGKYIVQRGDAVEAMRAIRDGKIEPIDKVAPATPPALAMAFLWALLPMRFKRATAADLAQALEAFIKSSPDIATAMQLGSWIRLRFPREGTGQHSAISSPPTRGTQAGPGTHAAPGTAVANEDQGPHTLMGTQSAIAKLVDVQPWPNDLDDENAQTLKKSAPSPFESSTILETELIDHTETVLLPSAKDPIVPSGPTVVPTMIAAAVPAPASQSAPRPRVALTESGPRSALGDSSPRHRPLETGQRRKTAAPVAVTSKRLIAIAGLVGLAVLSFVIALAASGGHKQEAARDAAAVVVAVPHDAAVAVAIDAAVLAPPPAIDAAPAEGYLEVRTIPTGGKIKVGDQVRGTPAQLVLAAGTVVVQAALAGYEPENREVELQPGEHESIEITFRKKIATARPVERGLLAGKLSVRTTPYSNVFEGTREFGQTPFADLEMSPGTHTLTFRNPSHEPVTRTVRIVPGKSTKLSFALP